MESNLEAYLSAIEAELKDVPATRKSGFMAEVCAHLQAMFEAKRADGHDTATAWLHTTREFGEPEKVGRELRAQWASSSQMESEGTPLSKRRKLRMFALPIALSVVTYALLRLIGAPQNNAGWQFPVLAALAFGCFAFGTASDVRKRGGWKPSTIVGCAGAFIILSNALFSLSGHQNWGGAWRDWGNFAFVMIYASLYHWLSKRERANRPWQFSARYKTSPVAAEQEYRIYPLVGLAMGTVLSCIGLISMGSQFFGWPLTLFLCAGSIGAAAVFGKWLIK